MSKPKDTAEDFDAFDCSSAVTEEWVRSIGGELRGREHAFGGSLYVFFQHKTPYENRMEIAFCRETGRQMIRLHYFGNSVDLPYAGGNKMRFVVFSRGEILRFLGLIGFTSKV
jgi:hypothetical protein